MSWCAVTALPFRKPRPAHACHGLQAREPRAQDTLPSTGQPIRTTTIVGGQWLDPLPRLEPRDRAVERARTELLTRERGDVLRHRVAVLRAVGERDQNEQRRL